MSFFDSHKQFLPMNHKYRKNINDFFFEKVEIDVALSLLSGEELYEVVSAYDDIVFRFQSDKHKFHGFGLIYN
jgi:hypothetical protein